MTIVVGIDGSEHAVEALRWAVDEAKRRNTSVTLVHSWEMPVIQGRAPKDLPHETFEERAQRVLSEVLEKVPAHHDIEVHTAITNYSPAQALVEASRDAELVVVGSRGLGGFKGLLLGSVAQQVAHHSACPVVIVRPR
jgi:nucleotide-binding universal stress UspA family protein